MVNKNLQSVVCISIQPPFSLTILKKSILQNLEGFDGKMAGAEIRDSPGKIKPLDP